MNTPSIVVFAIVLMAPLTCQAATAVAADAFPPVQIVDQVKHYPITGNSIRQVNDQLVKHARQSEDPGNGSTRSRFEIDRRQLRRDGRCELASLQVRVTVTTTLPRWQPEPAASASVRQQWRQSAGILKRHEAGHRSHALGEARRLRNTLLGIGPKRSCISLDSAMNLELQSSMQRLNLRDAHFDSRTWNGLRDDPMSPETSTLAPNTQPHQRPRQPVRKLLDFYDH